LLLTRTGPKLEQCALGSCRPRRRLDKLTVGRHDYIFVASAGGESTGVLDE
jgi:hypothetical protein